MKTKGLKYSLLLCIVAFLASLVGYVSGVSASRKQAAQKPSGEAALPANFQNVVQNVQEEKLPPLPHSQEITQTYILKENNGNIALFTRYSDGKEELHDTYEVSLSLLPESDRKQLEKGIECSSLSEALQLIEDYSS